MTEVDILLIEDNSDDEALTLRAFRKNNITDIVVMHDGVEALDYLNAQGRYADRNRANLPRLVLLDLKLPRMDGLEVLAQIRANPSTRLLPVVALTSSNEQQDILRSYNEGANSYIRKPVDYMEFIDVTKHLANYWLRHNVPPPFLKEV